jgi:hypothetical protein
MHRRRKQQRRKTARRNEPAPLEPGETCLVPLDDSSRPKFCSKPAVEKRVFEGLWFPICAAHARELEEEEECEDEP